MLLEGTHDKEGFHVQHNETGPGSIFKEVMLQNLWTRLRFLILHRIAESAGWLFYYHFKDIYDLVEWSCLEDAKRALQGKKTYDTWQEGILQIFEAVLENKPFILNAYHSVSREQIENYLFHLT